MKPMKLRLTIFDGMRHFELILEREFNDLKHATNDLFNLKNLIIGNIAYNLGTETACLVKIEQLD